MDKNGIILAARYAKSWLQVYPDVLTIQDIPKLYALAAVLVYWGGLTEQQQHIVFDEFSCTNALCSLIDLLSADRRIFLLSSVLYALAEYALCRRNIQYMTLESSHEISKTDRERVAHWVAQQIHTEVMYQYKINPELIMGLALYSDTYAWECSARKVLASYALLMPSGVHYGN